MRISGEIVKGDIVEVVIVLGEIAVDQTVDRRTGVLPLADVMEMLQAKAEAKSYR